MKEKGLRSSSRRRFLGGSGTAVLTAVPLTTGGVSAAPLVQQWDETYEVIIVGSGLAATVAALSVLEAGVIPIMLEKMPVAGGSSATSSGTFSFPETAVQKKYAIDDSWQSYRDDLLSAGAGYNQPELVDVLAREAAAGYRFLLEHGARFEDYVMPFPGHSHPRVLQAAQGCAYGVLHPLRDSCLKKGGVLRTRCRVDEIVFDSTGRAAGVKVRENYRFDPRLTSDDIDNTSGHIRCYRAKRGIICATGSFISDVEFRSQEVPLLRHGYTSQQPGATASGFRLLANAGARMVHTCFFRPAFPQMLDMMLGMMVDCTTGHRFVKEDLGRVGIFNQVMPLLNRNKGVVPISIFDARVQAIANDKDRLQRNLNIGRASQHETIESLAQHYNIPLTPLKESIRQYNRYALQKHDPDFARDYKANKGLGIEAPPFYAVQVRPDVNNTMGGALINARAEVIGLNTNAPIPGLYAAGESTGGVHGMNLLNSLVACVVFGRIAGARAAMVS